MSFEKKGLVVLSSLSSFPLQSDQQRSVSISALSLPVRPLLNNHRAAERKDGEKKRKGESGSLRQSRKTFVSPLSFSLPSQSAADCTGKAAETLQRSLGHSSRTVCADSGSARQTASHSLPSLLHQPPGAPSRRWPSTASTQCCHHAHRSPSPFAQCTRRAAEPLPFRKEAGNRQSYIV